MRALAAVLAALALAPLVPAELAAWPMADLDCDPACNVRVTTTTGPANEVHIAANPRDPDNLVAVAKDYALGDLAPCRVANVWTSVSTSFDGGRTWTNRLMPGHPADPVPTVLSAYPCSSDPVVAFDGKGRALLTGLSLAPPPLVETTPYNGWSTAVWVAQSMDGGQTWPLVTYAAPGPAVYPALFHDKQWLGVDARNGAAYLAFTDFTVAAAPIVTQRSAEGLAWTPPVPALAATPGPGLATCTSGIGATPFPGPQQVNVGWLCRGDLVMVGHSLDGLTTFEGIVTAATVARIATPNSPYRVPTMPAFATDATDGPRRGWVYAAWQDARFGSPDIVVTHSRDDGHTYSAPVRITDDPPGPNVQFFPAMAVGPDGTVHVVWYDRRHDPGNYLVDLYYTFSEDGGTTWAPNQRVTTRSFDPALSRHQNGGAFLGDYIGLAVGADGVAHPAWADTRTGRADVFTARILPSK